MKQGLYKVEYNRQIAEGIFEICLKGDTSAFRRGGQFADVAVEGKFLRRPFAATWWTEDRFAMIYKIIGDGTARMSRLQSGSELDVLTGLGNGFDATKCREAALVVSGGLGASPLFTLVKELSGSGRKVTVILGFNRASEVVLFDEYRSLGVDVHVVTMDGSLGMKGLVTDAIDRLDVQHDFFYTCGPKVMMKAVCGKLDAPGEASLEERMGCGCGICYGCTCHTAEGPKRVCADGPVFNKEDIIW